MNKPLLIGFLTILVIGSLIIAGIIFVDFEEDEVSAGKLYTYPISVVEKTYVISVRSNYSSAPEVGYLEFDKSVIVNFIGDQENVFCNITIPVDLIWGELSVIDKYDKMSDAYYTESNNSTHNSIYFTFNHNALVKHFEIRGTEGVSEFPGNSGL